MHHLNIMQHFHKMQRAARGVSAAIVADSIAAEMSGMSGQAIPLHVLSSLGGHLEDPNPPQQISKKKLRFGWSAS